MYLTLVFGNSGQNRRYKNDGSGTFTDATATSLPVDVHLEWGTMDIRSPSEGWDTRRRA